MRPGSATCGTGTTWSCPSDREAEVEALFDQVGTPLPEDDEDDDDGESRYHAIEELFAAADRLAGDPGDEQRAADAVVRIEEAAGPPPHRAGRGAVVPHHDPGPNAVGVHRGGLRRARHRRGGHRPARPPARPWCDGRLPLGLLLTPGAGADRDQPALVAIDEAATAAGVTVVRMDFPYRKAGRKAPDRPPVLIQAVREEAARLAARVRGVGARRPIDGRAHVLDGRGRGSARRRPGADQLPAASTRTAGPATRTSTSRTFEVPCLFVSGTRDAFGTPDELEAATRAIPGPVTHRWIDGKDHGLRGTDRAVAAAMRRCEWLGEAVEPGSRRWPMRAQPKAASSSA